MISSIARNYEASGQCHGNSDLKVFVWNRHLKSGVLDHVPANLPDRVAPKLVEHYELVRTTRASAMTHPVVDEIWRLVTAALRPGPTARSGPCFPVPHDGPKRLAKAGFNVGRLLVGVEGGV